MHFVLENIAVTRADMMCRVQCTTGPLAQATPWQKLQTFVSLSLSAHCLTYRSGLQSFIIRPNRQVLFAMLCVFFESWLETFTLRFACFNYIRVRHSNVVMSQLPHYYLTQSDLDLSFLRLRYLASWLCARRLPWLICWKPVLSSQAMRRECTRAILSWKQCVVPTSSILHAGRE